MSYRAVFFDASHARAAAQRLVTDGFTAQVLRHPRPDDDHAWVVLSDAPEVMLELLVEQYDGWLETAST